MTVVIIKPENRLGKLMGRPDGMLVGDALRRADENLLAIQDDCVAAVDKRLAEIELLRQGTLPGMERETARQLYKAAEEIHGLAGVFGLAALGEAAESLCELVDRLTMAGRWDDAAVEVHVGALRLLRHDHEHVHRDSVLAGLHEITGRIPKPVLSD